MAELKLVDLGFGIARLPSDLQETTWYEYRHATHTLQSITIDRTEIASACVGDWALAQRARVLSRGMNAGNVEPFSNDQLACQGFWYEPKQKQGPGRLFLIGVPAASETLMLLVQSRDESGNLVRALVERILPEAIGSGRLAIEDWQWRKAFDIWLPVPVGSVGPRAFMFEADARSVSIEFPEQAPDLELPWGDTPLADSDWTEFVTELGLPGRISYRRADLATGQATSEARVLVRSQRGCALVHCRDKTAAFASANESWLLIARSVTVREGT